MKKFLLHPFLIVSAILLVDQSVKIWIKLNMYLGQEFPVFGNWFIIHFTENNGMAFGLEFGNEWGKLILSLFRIIAIGALTWYLIRIYKQKAPRGVVICISMILAGAIGNVLDSLFYGMIFSDSYGNLATLFPDGGGYSSFLYGKVVDMLFFPLIEGFLPLWVPIWGGEYFVFFRPVFNIADSSISIGVISLIIFYRQFFRDENRIETTVSDLS
ncbi:MAG TPA: lipoprotein signal peptidase [Flavobacteriales bacterium]|nr:lipoprotein signal peptidase [Flavobacteriales bacterium]